MPADAVFAPPVADAAKVDALRVHALYVRARQALVLATLGSLFLGWIEKGLVGWPLVLVWMSLNAIGDFAVFVLANRFLRKPPPDARIPYWHNLHVFLRALQGLSWGAACLFFHVGGPNSFTNDLTVLIVLVAVSAASVVNMAPSFRSQAWFSVSIKIVPLVQYLWLGDAQHVEFAIGLIVLLVAEVLLGWEACRQFTDGVAKIVQNQAISQQLEQRNEQLAEAVQKLNVIATHDELTGAYNRRYIVDQLDLQHQMFERYGNPCSVALLDIDYFKQVNDRYGHAIGDAVLMAFVLRLEQELRQEDFLGRYGGEEFLLVLPMTDLAAAQHLTERIREVVSSTPMLEQPALLFMTASFGIAQLMKGESVDGWLARADQALYRAKKGGRNRVVVAEAA